MSRNLKNHNFVLMFHSTILFLTIKKLLLTIDLLPHLSLNSKTLDVWTLVIKTEKSKTNIAIFNPLQQCLKKVLKKFEKKLF